MFLTKRFIENIWDDVAASPPVHFPQSSTRQCSSTPPCLGVVKRCVATSDRAFQDVFRRTVVQNDIGFEKSCLIKTSSVKSMNRLRFNLNKMRFRLVIRLQFWRQRIDPESRLMVRISNQLLSTRTTFENSTESYTENGKTATGLLLIIFTFVVSSTFAYSAAKPVD